MVSIKRARSPSSSALVQEGPPKIPRHSFYPFQHLITTVSTLTPTTITIETAPRISLCPARMFATFPYLPSSLSGYEPDNDSSDDSDDEEGSSNVYGLLTNPNRDFYDEEILEVSGTHLNDIIPPEAWEVELTWRERGILGARRDADVQLVKTAIVQLDSWDMKTDPSRETVTNSQQTVVDSSQDILKIMFASPRDTGADFSQDGVVEIITDPPQDDGPMHGTPTENPHSEETRAYSNKILENELQWRRRSWQGVLPKEIWAQLKDPNINITTDDFVGKVGNRESDDIQTDAWERGGKEISQLPGETRQKPRLEIQLCRRFLKE